MGAMGLFGLPFPEEHGGMGGDYFALCLALEELARVDSSVAITLEAGVSLGAMPIYRFGTEEQQRALAARSSPPVGAGRVRADRAGRRLGRGRHPHHGPARRRRVGDQRLKAFITNAGTDITALVTVTAVTGDAARRRQGDLLDHRAGAARRGSRSSQKYSKVGWSASDTRELSFDDCRVPAANLLGERGRGYAQFLSILDEGRIAIAALAVGLAQGCVDESRALRPGARGVRPHDRRATRRSQFKIADMEVRAHTARLAYYDAAAKMLRGEPFKKEAAIAKLVASDAAMDNARDATQVFGGYGFMNEYPVARFYRDAKILEIGEGTSEVQRMLIARELGL